MLTLTRVARRYGPRTLFEDVSLQILPGRRVGLVGPNGAGKTTLLELLAGHQRPDDGEVTRAKGLTVGYLTQDVAERRGRSILEDVVAAAGHIAELEQRMRRVEVELSADGDGDDGAQESLLAEYARCADRYEQLGGYGLEAEARRVLAGLGFSDEDFGRDIGELSGGWMMRVALARLLLAGPDVLLLDEPTNHLDLDSVTWLEDFLASYAGAVVLTSHDREFLNAVVTRIVELAHGTATEYVGDYAAFVEQRELRMEQLRAAAANQQRKIAQTERFIERFRYKASKAAQVQSRVKALDKLDRVEVPDERAKAIRFRFPAPPRSGRVVIRLDGVAKAYGDTVVYDELDFVLERGHKVALVGPNGAGKSTLLKLLAGVVDADAGERELGHNVRVAYFAQHAVDALRPERTVLDEMSAVVDTSAVNPRSMLGAFLFSGEDADKSVSVLSGGEKSRLALARLLADPVNLLCMDEPTNHLDIASRDVLEDALVEYPGTVVLITHDRHLIRSVADTIVEVRALDPEGQGPSTVTIHPGGYDDYLWRIGGAADAEADPEPSPADRTQRDPQRKRAEAEERNRRYRETKQVRSRLDEVERDLMRVESEVTDLERLLADPEVYEDGERVAELGARHRLTKDREQALLEEWEQLSETLESATSI
jgi:ATP-binding cassette, subfamily F, member 3